MKTNQFITILMVFLLVIFIGGCNNINSPISQNSAQPVPKGNIEFSEIVHISGEQGAQNRGYIAGSIDGHTFWVTDNKLAYVLNYFDTKQNVLYYDGKEIYRSKYPDFIYGAQRITDVLAYYTFGKDFFFGEKIYPNKGTFFDAISVREKIALSTSEGLFYDGKIIEPASARIGRIFDIGGKLAYLKLIKDDSGVFHVLILDGKEIARGAYISEVIDYNGAPAYVLNSAQLGKQVVMYNGKAVSKPYDKIANLQVIDEKLAFLAQKKSIEKMQTYMLVYDSKEYGKEYDSVMVYVSSNGLPAYIAVNYKRDNGKYNDYGALYLIKNGNKLFYSATGEERIWQPKEVIDINGTLAAIIRAPRTDSLYVWYDGKKFFEGYHIYNILNVNGKLAILAEKDRVQYIFLEK